MGPINNIKKDYVLKGIGIPEYYYHLKLLLLLIHQHWIDNQQVDHVCAELLSAGLSFDSPVIHG